MAVETGTERFPRTFWSALTTELFERAAYYAMASFVVIYLGQLGLGAYWPSTLNGLLWSLVYFLPILSGTVADHVGYRRSLIVAFVLLVGGYLLMGSPVWLGLAELQTNAGPEVTAAPGVVVPLIAALLLIGLGGSVVKPCILGTAQRSAGTRATLAFAIFYMVVNIGSLTGRITSYLVRTHTSLSNIFAVAAVCAVAAFCVVLFVYRDPPAAAGVGAKPKKSVGKILADMVLVLRNKRFAMFLLVSSGFNFLYAQVYNVVPLYLKKVVESNPAVDLYTMANPIVIVCFQLLITRMFGRMKPVRSIIAGTVIISASMAVNLVPIALSGVRLQVADLLPLGSVFLVLTVAMIAFGELFASARTFEYIGALAPKGQEGLFLGYANLPMAIGALVGNPVGAAIFNEVMCHNAVERGDKLLELDPFYASMGWVILVGVGLASAAALWWYDSWVRRE
jgi:dipeptide/tripeptide permease